MRPPSVRHPRRNSGNTVASVIHLLRDARNGEVECESSLEEDWVIREDAYDQPLAWIVSQPLVDAKHKGLPYWFDGRHRVWFPDFVRQRKGLPGHQAPRPDLVEVKPLGKIYPDDPDEQKREFDRAYLEAKYSAMRLAAMARGYGFSLATENEIRIQPSRSNADLLRMCGGKRVPPSWEKIGRLAALRLPRESGVRELERTLPSDVDAFAVALRLAWLGELIFDPTEKWTRGTSFSRV